MSALKESISTLFEAGKKSQEQTRLWKRFLEMGLPDLRQDAYRYFPLEKLYEEKLHPVQELSYNFQLPAEVVALPLQEAKRKFGSLFFKEKKSALALLPQVLTEEGFFLYIPPDVQLQEPLDLSMIFPEKKSSCPKLTIFMGENAEAKIARNLKCEGWAISSIELFLERGAKLTWEESLFVAENARYLHTLKGQLRESALFQTHTLRWGPGIGREDLEMQIKGKNAEAILKGGALLASHAEHHVQVLAHHVEPSACSHQYYKNILQDEARASFEGKIYVEKEALKTDAYQLVNHLLLSPAASAFSKPNLEIFADDVKASHGATIAQMNEEQIHYLLTRGLTRQEANSLLQKGFFLSLFSGTDLKQKVEELL